MAYNHNYYPQDWHKICMNVYDKMNWTNSYWLKPLINKFLLFEGLLFRGCNGLLPVPLPQHYLNDAYLKNEVTFVLISSIQNHHIFSRGYLSVSRIMDLRKKKKNDDELIFRELIERYGRKVITNDKIIRYLSDKINPLYRTYENFYISIKSILSKSIFKIACIINFIAFYF